jgi:hypothetical protein
MNAAFLIAAMEPKFYMQPIVGIDERILMLDRFCNAVHMSKRVPDDKTNKT